MIQRGDIRWLQVTAPAKRRPVLVLGRDDVLPPLSEIPVIPLSTQIRSLPWEVRLSEAEGLRGPCVLKPEWIRSVPRSALGPWLASLPQDRWAEVRNALLNVLGLPLA
jgi:mRNA-degrading endonuclease toxin of MazEF toxin-antitoxin module